MTHRVLVVRCPAWDGVTQSVPPGDWANNRVADTRSPGQGVGRQARAFERVVSAVGEFCPRIEVLRSGICAIDTRGPASYFGGEAELARGLTQAVSRLGFDCGVGVADGMFAALLAARDGLFGWLAGEAGEAGVAGVRGGVPVLAEGVRVEDLPVLAGAPVVIVPPGATPAYLAPRSVVVLGQSDLADLLLRLGIETVGEFAALPAAEVESRFGPPGLLAHRVARGLDPRPLVARPPSTDMSVQIDFDPPVEQAERVVFAAKSLAGQMHAKLAAGGYGCVRMQVQMVCADGQEITRLWRHDGLLTELAVAERVRWQLDGWRPGGRGVDRGGLSSGSGPGGGGGDHGGLSSGSGPGGGGGDHGGLSGGSGPGGGGFGGGGDHGGPNDGGGLGGGSVGALDDDGAQVGGICRLRLVPDQLVRDQGRQLGLWGDAVVSDRVARAARRVQAMLGHDAVRQPVLTGGRSPGDQVLAIPFGEPRPASQSAGSGRPVGSGRSAGSAGSAGPGRLAGPAGSAGQAAGSSGSGRLARAAGAGQAAGWDERFVRPTDRPWPGAIPPPAPATVYPEPRPARVTDGSGKPVTVTGRGLVSADPARLSVGAGPPLAITAWTGPWPVTERWWDPARACRKARFQLVTVDGNAWLAIVMDGQWLIEASYS